MKSITRHDTCPIRVVLDLGADLGRGGTCVTDEKNLALRTDTAVQVFPSAGFAFGIIRSRRPRGLDALADGPAIATPVACFNWDMLTVIGDDANDVATFERSELSIAMRQRTADFTTDTIADSPSPSRGSFSAMSPRAHGLRRQRLEVPLDRSS